MGLLARLLKRNAARPARPNLDALSDIAGLLNRPAISLDTPELQSFLAGKRVMVTGAGGSIGSEICRQVARFCPGRLILVERCENALFEIDSELRGRYLGTDLRPCMADVTDERRIDTLFREHRPQVVFHCAAHKHVPMMECNPGEAVKNNVLGTAVIADAAAEYATAAMVLVSTDKAVNPTSVMGASKRCAELYVQGMSGHSQTRFLSVRFGNVIGSSGSVVPIFKRQIAAGGPVTITHAEMRRYFMTIPEAAQLVMQAGAIGKGGEIFLLDMGEPVKIIDLAKAMIAKSGLVEGRDIDIEVTGIRPGEKLFEELSCNNEVAVTTSHPKIAIWRLPPASETQARLMLSRLSEVTGSPRTAVVAAIQAFVPEYLPEQSVVETQKPATQMRLHRPAA